MLHKWRVGTISMGIALIFTGIILLISQIDGKSVFQVYLYWWPVIFILLGLELLIYLFFAKRETRQIKYDFLSVFIVGALGGICLLYVVFSSTGLLEVVHKTIEKKVTTSDLPIVQQAVSPDIKRIVVQANDYLMNPIHIEPTNDPSIHLFGSYQAITYNNTSSPISSNDFSSIHIIGDTMFVTIKEMPQHQGLYSDLPMMNITLVLPNNLPAYFHIRSNKVDLDKNEKHVNWHFQT